MTNQKSKKRLFKSMVYREVQFANSKSRDELSKADRQWLKNLGCKNVGWDQVIILYQRIEELIQERDSLNDLSLGDLFLEADRIGNKYFAEKEITANNQILTSANNVINSQIDKSFPDTVDEIIDFSAKLKPKLSNKNTRK